MSEPDQQNFRMEKEQYLDESFEEIQIEEQNKQQKRSQYQVPQFD